MKIQKIIWTALPNGLSEDGKHLRLSAFVSPRLQPEFIGGGKWLNKSATLTQFPDFLDWPATMLEFLATGLAVEFKGGAGYNGPTLFKPELQAPKPETELWKALFDGSTYVRPHEFDKYDDYKIHSYPVKHVMSFLKDQYLKIAVASPAALPPVEFLSSADSFGRLAYGETGEFGKDLVELDKTLSRKKAAPPSPSPDNRMDFLQAKVFHLPKNVSYVKPAIPKIDFHQMVSSLGEYPEALRWLGLVIDIEIPFDQKILSMKSPRVRVTHKLFLHPADYRKHLAPWTRCDLAPRRFMAASRPVNPELKNGMLKLGDDHYANGYTIVQVDVDGAAIKAMDFAANLQQSQKHKTTDTPDATGVPSLRSGGISVVRNGRAFKMAQAFVKAKDINHLAESNQEVVLYAEDLVRGYRIDVWDSASSRWHSLCKRVGRYRFANAGIEKLVGCEGEGCEGIVSAGVTRAADGSSKDLFLHESLFHWDGWSLCAPRPGRTILKPEGGPERVAAVQNKAATAFKLETDFKAAPGTLPRLRFNVKYRLRARAVDLAGNSVPFGDPRERPDAPWMQSTGDITYTRFEPVSSPALALRKSPPPPGESLARLVIRSNYDTEIEEASERHVAPPKTSQQLAETHGMFDLPTEIRKDAYQVITAKEGSLNDCHPEPSLQPLPYLPDPLARGAAFRDLPGTPPDEVKMYDFGKPEKWPEARPFRICLIEGDGAPDWDNGARVLTVQLPKAEVARVKLSSYLTQNDLQLMGMWRWIEEIKGYLHPKVFAPMLNAALTGSFWLLTPFREITLVHAVRQPLKEPVLVLDPSKGLGKTYANLNGTVAVHGKSTIKLDVTAEWSEPVDDLSDSGPKTIRGKAHVFEAPVNLDGDPVTVNGGKVRYWTDKDIVLMGSGPVQTDIAAPRHEFGDTKYRSVTYAAIATTRFREYFPPDSKESFTRKSAYETKDILNSARPAAPKVLYVLPVFGWGEKEWVLNGVTRKRSGGCLRVYLERPWYSSGDGERLGVVLWEKQGGYFSLGTPEIPEELKSYVTQWGMDPIWLSGPTYATQSLANFKRTSGTQTGLSLDELPANLSANPKYQVSVAGYPVEYDDKRRLWYCDIELDAGPSYFPFVRLALARYQPKSVEGAHLSRVVLADFVQLAPDRTATVVFDTLDPERRKLKATVSGPAYSASHAGQSTSEVEVSVEKRSSVADEALCWIPASKDAFALQPVPGSNSTTVWSGDVTLPESLSSGSFRLVIREYERFRVEGGKSLDLDNITWVSNTERRLVYADVLELRQEMVPPVISGGGGGVPPIGPPTRG